MGFDVRASIGTLRAEIHVFSIGLPPQDQDTADSEHKTTRGSNA